MSGKYYDYISTYIKIMKLTRNKFQHGSIKSAMKIINVFKSFFNYNDE